MIRRHSSVLLSSIYWIIFLSYVKSIVNGAPLLQNNNEEVQYAKANSRIHLHFFKLFHESWERTVAQQQTSATTSDSNGNTATSLTTASQEIHTHQEFFKDVGARSKRMEEIFPVLYLKQLVLTYAETFATGAIFYRQNNQLAEAQACEQVSKLFYQFSTIETDNIVSKTDYLIKTRCQTIATKFREAIKSYSKYRQFVYSDRILRLENALQQLSETDTSKTASQNSSREIYEQLIQSAKSEIELDIVTVNSFTNELKFPPYAEYSSIRTKKNVHWESYEVSIQIWSQAIEILETIISNTSRSRSTIIEAVHKLEMHKLVWKEYSSFEEIQQITESVHTTSLVWDSNSHQMLKQTTATINVTYFFREISDIQLASAATTLAESQHVSLIRPQNADSEIQNISKETQTPSPYNSNVSSDKGSLSFSEHNTEHPKSPVLASKNELSLASDDSDNIKEYSALTNRPTETSGTQNPNPRYQEGTSNPSKITTEGYGNRPRILKSYSKKSKIENPREGKLVTTPILAKINFSDRNQQNVPAQSATKDSSATNYNNLSNLFGDLLGRVLTKAPTSQYRNTNNFHYPQITSVIEDSSALQNAPAFDNSQNLRYPLKSKISSTENIPQFPNVAKEMNVPRPKQRIQENIPEPFIGAPNRYDTQLRLRDPKPAPVKLYRTPTNNEYEVFKVPNAHSESFKNRLPAELEYGHEKPITFPAEDTRQIPNYKKQQTSNDLRDNTDLVFVENNLEKLLERILGNGEKGVQIQFL